MRNLPSLVASASQSAPSHPEFKSLAAALTQPGMFSSVILSLRLGLFNVKGTAIKGKEKVVVKNATSRKVYIMRKLRERTSEFDQQFGDQTRKLYILRVNIFLSSHPLKLYIH